MKKIIIVVLAVCSFAVQSIAADGVINVASNFTVVETASRMVNIIQKKKLTLFNQISHSSGAKGVGVELRPTELLIFGSPKVGAPLMKCQQSVSIDLPLKALIWQDEKSKVWISYNDMNYLTTRHNISGCEKTIAKMTKALAGITKSAAGSQ